MNSTYRWNVRFVAVMLLCSMAALAHGAASPLHGSGTNQANPEESINAGVNALTVDSDWLFTNSFEVDDQVPFAIRISPSSWADAWIGARKQFSAVVINANGQPLEGESVFWTTNNSAAIDLNSSGFATALQSGDAGQVIALNGGLADVADVNVAFDGSSGPGVMFSVWFARSDNAPALLVNGHLELPNISTIYHPLGTPDAPWPDYFRNSSNGLIQQSRPTIAKFQWDGDVIGLLTDVANGSGTFRARGRTRDWVNLAVANAVDFQLEENRIGLILDDGRFQVKDGILGAWTVLDNPGSDVHSFQLEGDTIAELHDSGLFRVKVGINGAWTTLAAAGTGVRSFRLSGKYIGLLSENGLFRVKEGVNGAWTNLADEGSGVESFQLVDQLEYDENDDLVHIPYIGLLQDDGGLLAKRTINGAWTLLANSGVADVKFEGNPRRDASIDEIRIGALYDDGMFRVKDGINGAWTLLAAPGTGVVSFKFQNNLIGTMSELGALRVKEGVNGAWVSTPAYGAGVSEYQLLVDVPARPERTSFENYVSQQALCMTQGNDCYAAYQDGILDLVPLYGRNCGRTLPSDPDWARQQGPTDGLDWTCRHHDAADGWYPEAYGAPVFNYTGSCIVRYALRHSRLTRDGMLLAYGEDDDPFNSSNHAWDFAWNPANMLHLKDALSAYSRYTSECPDFMLDAFTEATASGN